MEKKYDVVALGELLVDMAEGEKSANNNMTFEACPGGAPCNVLAMLSKTNHKTAFIGKVGDDFLGHMLAHTIESAKIDSGALIFDKEHKTTLAFVHKKPDGDRDFSFYRNPGADMMLEESEVDFESINQSRIFHFGTLSMTHAGIEKATKAAVTYARDNHVLVSFDPNYRAPLWESEEKAKEKILWGMAHCDILKISDNEVTFITGEEDMSKAVEAVRPLTSAKVIFVTLGPDGSMAFAGDKTVMVPGEKVDQVVDTTGAGDTFFGSALHYILENGMDLDESKLKALLTGANYNAARITKKKGAIPVIMDLDLDEVLKSFC